MRDETSACRRPTLKRRSGSVGKYVGRIQISFHRLKGDPPNGNDGKVEKVLGRVSKRHQRPRHFLQLNTNEIRVNVYRTLLLRTYVWGREFCIPILYIYLLCLLPQLFIFLLNNWWRKYIIAWIYISIFDPQQVKLIRDLLVDYSLRKIMPSRLLTFVLWKQIICI